VSTSLSSRSLSVHQIWIDRAEGTPRNTNLIAALMSSILERGSGSSHMSLSMMPSEIATDIFCQLPCFADVFALSTVCHRLRRLWLKNVTPIYNEMAPRNIPCEGAARRFLVDQDGPDLESPMSAKDVVRMLRNADVVENAILQFEREIVSRVRSKWRLLHI